MPSADYVLPLLYHGTNVELQPGDVIRPGSEVGQVVEDFGDDTHDWVWMTPDPLVAHGFADAAACTHGGAIHVYEVTCETAEKNSKDYLALCAVVVAEVTVEMHNDSSDEESS